MSTALLSQAEKENLIEENWGTLPGFRREKNDYRSGCPECGPGRNSHRFYMPVDEGVVRGVCHNCGHIEYSKRIPRLSPEEKMERERQWEEKKERDRERREQQFKRQLVNEPWLAWHSNIGPKGVDAWLEEGIIEKSIEKYRLGFVEGRGFGPKEERFFSDALTIPFWVYDWEVRFMQFRMFDSPIEDDRYRPLWGMPPVLFNASPERPIERKIILVEGAKKAIVLSQELGPDYHVFAMPSLSTPSALLKELGQASEVSLVMDPDAFSLSKKGKPIDRIYRAIPAPCRIVKMAVKPDDYFTMYGGTPTLFLEKMKRSPVFTKGNAR